MAISRTPKNETTFDTPTAEIFDDVDGENKGKQEEDRYEKLAAQLAQLAKDNEELRQSQMQGLVMPSNANDFQVQLDDPMKIALPDPALDPDGFDKAQAERNRIRDENRQRQRDADERKQKHIKDKADQLQTSFAELYPEHAADKEKTDFASMQVLKDAQARGINVEAYMFRTQDRFLADVAKRYEKIFGNPVENDEFQEDEAQDDYQEVRRRKAAPAGRTQPRRRNRQEDDSMVQRTGGIFGGTESGGRPTRSKQDEDNGPDMIDDIQTMQRKYGFM